MNRQEIQQLLDAFLDGMTTVEQEQRLAEFFRSANDVQPEWEPFRRMFGWFDSGMTPTSLPQEVDVVDKEASLIPIHTRQKRIYGFARIASAAASVAILIGVFMNMPEPSKTTHPETAQESSIGSVPLPEKVVQTSSVASTEEKQEKSVTPHVTDTRDALKSSEKAITEAERIYNEQDHDMVDERYEDVRQAVSNHEVRSRGFFTAIDEQGCVRIIQCTNENTNQSNLVEL